MKPSVGWCQRTSVSKPENDISLQTHLRLEPCLNLFSARWRPEISASYLPLTFRCHAQLRIELAPAPTALFLGAVERHVGRYKKLIRLGLRDRGRWQVPRTCQQCSSARRGEMACALAANDLRRTGRLGDCIVTVTMMAKSSPPSLAMNVFAGWQGIAQTLGEFR